MIFSPSTVTNQRNALFSARLWNNMINEVDSICQAWLIPLNQKKIVRPEIMSKQHKLISAFHISTPHIFLFLLICQNHSASSFLSFHAHAVLKQTNKHQFTCAEKKNVTNKQTGHEWAGIATNCSDIRTLFKCFLQNP